MGAAFAAWPDGTLDRLEQLAKLYPEVAVVQLHLGLARLWANEGDPVEAWRAVLDAEPDTPYAIVAGNLLHPDLPRGLPAFIPSFTAPAALTKLPPARQLEALRVAAKRGGVREQLLYGVGLQRVGRPRVGGARVRRGGACASRRRSRRRWPARSGSSTRTLPRRRSAASARSRGRTRDEPTVRFHLGVLLLWTGRIDGSRAPVPAALAGRGRDRRSRARRIATSSTIRRARRLTASLTTAAAVTTV